MKDGKYEFSDLVEIMQKLRAPGGCPWDREQTHQSIERNLIEEGYELIEALESGNGAKMADESGDLLMQVVFHATIGKEAGEYEISDVTDAVCRKLIHRHPHVFGETKVSGSEEVLSNWDAIKRADRKQTTIAEDLAGVSRFLPALMRAEKVQRKAEKNGYSFAAAPCGTAAQELGRKIAGADPQTAEQAVGKALFDVVNVARAAGVEPELALGRAVNAFIEEFAEFEKTKS